MKHVKDEECGLMLKGITPITLLPHYANDKSIIYDKNGELGTKFCSRLRVKSIDGNVYVHEDTLKVRNASEVVLILSASTNFEEFNIKQGSWER